MKMQRLSPIRLLLSLAVPLVASAQLPVTPPTTLPAQPPAQTTTQTRATPDQPSAHRAQVTWINNQLSVTADNSSLNQILRDISRQTGMKITGGIRDERVFGTYGPAETGTILASLLTGTGSNMLLKESHADTPLELVLTPRMGGPTPPSPISTQADDTDQADLPPQRIRPPMPFQQPPPTNIQSAATQVQNGQNYQPPPQQQMDPSDTGVRTPQQIYDQLMKLQQQKSATPPQL